MKSKEGKKSVGKPCEVYFSALFILVLLLSVGDL